MSERYASNLVHSGPTRSTRSTLKPIGDRDGQHAVSDQTNGDDIHRPWAILAATTVHALWDLLHAADGKPTLSVTVAARFEAQYADGKSVQKASPSPTIMAECTGPSNP